MKFIQNIKLKLDPDNIKDAYFDVVHFFKNLYNFTIKLFQYARILWKDADYDYCHILILLQYKIKRVREHIVKHDHIVSAPVIAKQIKYAEFLIQRILDDNYCDELQQAHEEKWGNITQYCDPPEPGKSYRKYHVIRKNATTLELEAQERAEQWAIYEQQGKALEKDKDRLFRHLRLYIDRWWD